MWWKETNAPASGSLSHPHNTAEFLAKLSAVWFQPIGFNMEQECAEESRNSKEV